MEKKKTGMLMTAIILANLIAAFSVFQYAQLETPRWRVNPGLAMTYFIAVTGNSTSVFEENITYGPPPFYVLDDSLISINVTSLPSLDDALSSSSFTEHVIDYLKTQQVGALRHYDGTEIVGAKYDFLNAVVSRCILPVGGWSLLDSFYVDEPEPGFVCNTYFSEVEQDGFLIGHRTYAAGSGIGWSAKVDTVTGVPFTLTIWAMQLQGIDRYSYSIVLTLSY
ncbi:MAG: hypothetical protein C4K47_00205 [Candidatus Thorarchaeota archaeon]|nr:MAG: hypothetical protein C4K47_00205 [Candidatus Thorarchaeota archaeon]